MLRGKVSAVAALTLAVTVAGCGGADSLSPRDVDRALDNAGVRGAWTIDAKQQTNSGAMVFMLHKRLFLATIFFDDAHSARKAQPANIRARVEAAHALRNGLRPTVFAETRASRSSLAILRVRNVFIVYPESNRSLGGRVKAAIQKLR